MSFEKPLAAAMSTFPSPLMSAEVRALRSMPFPGKLAAAEKPPLPSPKKTETSLEKFADARSGWPSPLKSAEIRSQGWDEPGGSACSSLPRSHRLRLPAARKRRSFPGSQLRGPVSVTVEIGRNHRHGSGSTCSEGKVRLRAKRQGGRHTGCGQRSRDEQAKNDEQEA